WSSDVCSSDLRDCKPPAKRRLPPPATCRRSATQRTRTSPVPSSDIHADVIGLGRRDPAAHIPPPVGAHAAFRLRPVVDRNMYEAQTRMGVGLFKRRRQFVATCAT